MAITTNQLSSIDVRRDAYGSTYAIPVTANDTNYILDPRATGEVQIASKGISVDVAGTIAVENAEGNSYTIPALAAGVIHHICGIVKVKATGTSATGINIWV